LIVVFANRGTGQVRVVPGVKTVWGGYQGDKTFGFYRGGSTHGLGLTIERLRKRWTHVYVYEWCPWKRKPCSIQWVIWEKIDAGK